VDKINDAHKRRYEKPVLRKIELVAQEIMAVCKIERSSPGPQEYMCQRCSTDYQPS